MFGSETEICQERGYETYPNNEVKEEHKEEAKEVEGTEQEEQEDPVPHVTHVLHSIICNVEVYINIQQIDT